MAVQSAVSGALSLTSSSMPAASSGSPSKLPIQYPEVRSMPVDDSNREEMIHTFAQQNRLPTSRETDKTSVIPGQAGCHLYEYNDSELGLMILSAKDAHPRRWAGIRKKCLEAGMTLRQDGEDEGAISFHPNNRQQARLAIKVTGARPKRQLCPEHRARLRAVGFQKRQSPTLKGVSSDKKPLETGRTGIYPTFTPEHDSRADNPPPRVQDIER